MLFQFFSISPMLSIAVVSLAVSFVITLIYRFTTDQKKMKDLKNDITNLRAEMKAAKDPKKMGDVNRRLMERTMDQFRLSMKPMLITMIPALIILGWMQANLAYQQIAPDVEFTTTAFFEKGATGEIELEATDGVQILNSSKQKVEDKVVWSLKGKEGDYELAYNYNSEHYSREIAITKIWAYKDPVLEKEKSFLGINTGDRYPIKSDSMLREIRIGNKPLHPFGEISIFGWTPGWLAAYIMLSLLFSMALRSLLKVY
ncbi:DUF106 domain-containing protein [Candidatus Woesearchaeota archaeon]|nr:DUF106 domain-containing protein [Candidatus Woesearchaeota archaeon]